MEQERSRTQLWRIFCAVELPKEVRAQVSEHVERLRRDVPHADARWERTEKLHITLKFIGEMEQPRVELLARAAARAAAAVAPFHLAVKGTGAFPPRGLARVLWLGLEDASGRLAALQRLLEDEAAREGFPREPRAFHPHLTIARLRTPASARTLVELHRKTEFETEAFNVTQLVVMRSELGRGGSRYTPLSSHQLEGKE